MTVLVRASALQGYLPLAASLGLAADPALARVGLTRQQLADHDALISYLAVIHLLEHSAQRASRPDFGLLLAQRQDIGILGHLAVLIRHASTAQEALALASHHIHLHSPILRLTLHAVPQDASQIDLAFDLDMPHLPPCTQTIELSIAIIVQSLQMVGQGWVRPLAVQFAHAPLSAPERYREALGDTVTFKQPRTAIRLRVADLAIRLPAHNAALQDAASGYLRHHFGDGQGQFSNRIEKMVRRFLDSGIATQQNIAQTLGIHPRTIQRRLWVEGITFEGLVDTVRQNTLKTIMAHDSVPGLAQVAQMLGFTEQAALSRACRRWFGCTPTALRRQLSPTSVQTPAKVK